MRKVLLILLLVVFVTSLPAAKAYLLPSRNGEPSEIVTLPGSKDAEVGRGVKGLMKVVDTWVYSPSTGGGQSALTGLEDCDTFLSWFVPPAACSVMKFWVWISAYTDVTQDQTTIFLAELDQTLNYSGDWDEYHGTGKDPGPRPITSILWSKDTIAPPGYPGDVDTMVGICSDTFDIGTDKFGVGWTKAYGDSSPNPRIYADVGNPPPYYTLIHRGDITGVGDTLGWYSSWHFIITAAYVNFYENPPPIVSSERIPDSYDIGARTVNVYGTDFGVPLDLGGVETCVIEYQVNGGSVLSVGAALYSGDSTDGFWAGDIPGVGAGDVVDYWVISTDYQGAADTSSVRSYEIAAGDPGDFLFVDNGYTVSGIIPGFYGLVDTVDVWTGDPDSSVYAFYNTVVIRDWGATYLGPGSDYGIGIYYSDSTWIKDLLDRGGNFWLSDQDEGYGLGICPDYGQYPVPVGHWVREYLGIQGMYDDHPLLGGVAVTAYGNPNDSIIGDMFGGIGVQNVGEVYIAPYYYLTNNFNYSYTGSFDSLQSGAVINMLEASNDLVISYRYEGPGGSDYKVYNDFFPWDFIAKPGAPDTLDLVAIDSLVSDVLGWFGYTSGVSDRTLDPEKVVKLLPVGIISGEAMIRFYLPGESLINLSIYDNTGRLIKKLKEGIYKAGLNSLRWDGKDSHGNSVPSGVYFYRLKTSDEAITNKMVVIK